MNSLTLTAEEIATLKQVHRACKDKRAADRIKAIYSLGIGFSGEDVAEILMLDDETVRSYVKKYQKGGIDELIADHYKGSCAYLSSTELSELEEHLEKNTYLTVDAIIAHVKQTYGVSYSLTGMNGLLHRLNFTYKKSKLVPAKANKENQEIFLAELKEIQETKGGNDPILYMDGVHPQYNTMLAYGWIKKGQDNIIKSNTGRQRINFNGLLDKETHEVLIREDESINATSTIDLLKKAEAVYSSASVIYVVCDNAKYYRSNLVSKFLETSRIKLVFLPPYSPNLNLIERLWKFMKKKILYNQYYEKFDAFKKAILGFFAGIQQYKSELDSLLTNKFQLLNAD